MKRRQFVKASGLILGGLTVARQVSAGDPCPPGGLEALGGTSGGALACPRPSGPAPAWVADLQTNQWTGLSNVNTMDAVYAPNTGQYAVNGPRQVMGAWSGAILATGLGNYGSMVHWGGGHADYYGNELYRFDLETLTWIRMNDPSPHCGSIASTNLPNGLFPDGTPGVPHTYDMICYRSAANEYVAAGREYNNSGFGLYNMVSRFNLDTRTWATHNTEPSGIATRHMDCIYDAGRDVMWAVNTYSGGSDWHKWDFATNAWTTYSMSGTDSLGAAQYVPTRDCIVYVNLAGTMYGLDTANPGDRVLLTKTGSFPSISSNNADPMFWSSELGSLIFCKSGTGNLYRVTPPSGDWKTGTWTVSPISASGSSGLHDSNGVYKKFQVAEWGSIVVAILNERPTQNCYAIRLQ